MVALLAVVFRWFLRPRLLELARQQAEKGLRGSMEGHAAMDMSVVGGSVWSRILSPRGATAISHSFVMEWAAVLRDIVIGLLIAGAVAAWVPDSFWQNLFLTDHETAAKFWGPVIGPIVAMISFVCSVGNVPLAAVLWNGGISFGGVIAFIYADLLILPILNIYRKYYGARTAVFLLGTFFAAMAVAGYVVEFTFGGLGLIPDQADATIPEEGITWNYTTWLNLVFLLLAAALLVRFWRTGGPAMLRMMGGSPDAGETEHRHGHAHTPSET